MSERDLVVFDLDGTLVDSAPDLAAAVDAALAEGGLPEPGEQRVRGWIGGGARLMLARALAWAGAADTEAAVADLYPVFYERYSAHVAERSRPYAGTEAMLETLARSGMTLAVATNKPERLARLLLAELDLAGRFAAIVGGDTTEAKKPSPAPLLAVCRSVGAEPRKGAMVGDAVVDLRAARAAGMSGLAAGWGYGRRGDLEAERPDALLAAPAAIPGALAPASWI